MTRPGSLFCFLRMLPPPSDDQRASLCHCTATHRKHHVETPVTDSWSPSKYIIFFLSCPLSSCVRWHGSSVVVVIATGVVRSFLGGRSSSRTGSSCETGSQATHLVDLRHVEHPPASSVFAGGFVEGIPRTGVVRGGVFKLLVPCADTTLSTTSIH